MKQLTTYALSALLMGTLSVTEASAVDYSPAGSDALTAELVAKKYTGSGSLTFGQDDGLQGTYVLSNPSMNAAKDSYSLYGEPLCGTAPEGKYFSSISAEGTTGEFEVYASETAPLTTADYEQGESLGTLTVGTPLSIATDKAYSYIALVGQDDVKCITFYYKQEGEAGPQGGVDHITGANLAIQNPDGNFNSDNYYNTPGAENALLTFVGESGSKFELSNVVSNGTFFSFNYSYDVEYGLKNTNPGGYINKVSIDISAWPEGYYYFYVSDQPLTKENYYNGKYVYLDNSDKKDHIEWEADGIYQYIYFGQYQQMISDFAIEWSVEKPVIKAKTPNISANTGWDMPFTPGTTVTVNADNGLNLDVKVYLDNELVEDLSKKYEKSNVEFEAPGEAGQVLKVEAFAYAEGYNDSDLATWSETLAFPYTARVVREGSDRDVYAGMELEYTCDTEGATIDYVLKIIGADYSPVKVFDKVTGCTSPLAITIPEEVEEGQSIEIEFTSLAPNHQAQTSYDNLNVVSKQVNAPYFSIENNSEVMKGTKVEISKSNHVSELVYTINGGEEQRCSEWSVKIPIEEDMTISAYCIAEEPFENSETVEYTYTLEKFTDNQHVLTPSLFVKSDEDYNKTEINEYKATVDNIEYVYSGGLYHYSNEYYGFDDNTFYVYTEGSILYNNTPINDGIRRIKVNNPMSYTAVYVVLSEEPVTEVTEELSNFDDPAGDKLVRIRIGGDWQAVREYGQWIDVSDFVTMPTTEAETYDAADKKTFVPKYVALYRYGSSSNYVQRFIVERNNKPTGVEAIEAETDGTEAIYDLNGVHVSGENLAPGIYIRKAGNKTSKFVVK